MPQTSFDIINSLDEVVFIAGTPYTFDYHIYDENGAEVNITACTNKLKICYYGQPEVVIIDKEGEIISPLTNAYRVVLSTTDSKLLSGKYIQQPTIIDITGEEYIGAQGVITIIPRIK